MGLNIDYLGSTNGLQTFEYYAEARVNVCLNGMAQDEVAEMLSAECFAKKPMVAWTIRKVQA
jgi:hypothetical protein